MKMVSKMVMASSYIMTSVFPVSDKPFSRRCIIMVVLVEYRKSQTDDAENENEGGVK